MIFLSDRFQMQNSSSASHPFVRPVFSARTNRTVSIVSPILTSFLHRVPTVNNAWSSAQTPSAAPLTVGNVGRRPRTRTYEYSLLVSAERRTHIRTDATKECPKIVPTVRGRSKNEDGRACIHRSIVISSLAYSSVFRRRSIAVEEIHQSTQN